MKDRKRKAGDGREGSSSDGSGPVRRMDGGLFV